MNILGDLMIFGGGKPGVIRTRAFEMIGCLILFWLVAALPARALDGNYTVSESWTVTIQDGHAPPQTFRGKETGTLSIVNNQYSLIDHTGISGGDTNIHVHTIAGGPPYTIIGEYPYAGTGIARGFVAVIHLSFFSIGIPQSTPSDGALKVAKSTTFNTTGSSLTGLSGSGTQDNADYYFFTANTTSSLTPTTPPPPPAPFFTGQASLGNDVYYLGFTNANYFGFYSLLDFPYVYHFDLGFEYFTDANNSAHGCYLYDFTSKHFWYTDPNVFPYLYDFSLSAWLYYFPNTKLAGHYLTDQLGDGGQRVFVNLSNGQFISD